MASQAMPFNPGMFMPPPGQSAAPRSGAMKRTPGFLGLPSGGGPSSTALPAPGPVSGGGGGSPLPSPTAPRPMGDPNGGIVNAAPPGTPLQPGASTPLQKPQATSGPYTPQMFSMGLPRAANTSGFQGQDLMSADYEKANQGALISQSSGILDFASGNPQDSPLYKALLSQGRSSIGSSYDQAIANTRSAAASRGFGYSSPNEEGAEAGMRSSEAGAFSAEPSQALQGAIQPEMQAAGILTNQAGQYAGEAMSEEQMVTALQQARMGKQSAMMGDIAGVVDAMISGASKVGAAEAGKP